MTSLSNGVSASVMLIWAKWTKKEQLERDPEAPKGIEGTIGKTLTKVGMEEIKKLPGGGFIEMLPTDAIAGHVGDVMSFIRKKITNKDELELLLEPVKVLTPLFIEEISECAEDRDICLIFDTYEVAFPKLDDWLRHIFDSQYGDLRFGNLIMRKKHLDISC